MLAHTHRLVHIIRHVHRDKHTCTHAYARHTCHIHTHTHTQTHTHTHTHTQHVCTKSIKQLRLLDYRRITIVPNHYDQSSVVNYSDSQDTEKVSPIIISISLEH